MRENFVLFRLQDYLNQVDYDDCTIHFLSGQTRSLVLACLRYSQFWGSRWYVDSDGYLGEFSQQELDQIENITDEAKGEIIMGCNAGDFIKTQRMLLAALTGETVNLDSDLPTGNYTPPVAVAPALIGDSGNLAQAVEALNVALENIETALGQAPDDLEDDLANVWAVLQAITLALGGTVPAPPLPL